MGLLNRFLLTTPFCGEEEETIKYLFFHCSYAQAVWALTPNPPQVLFSISTKFLDVCMN